MSSAATEEAENELNALLTEIQRAVLDDDTASAIALCKNASAVLTERNRVCKLSKH